MTHLCHLKMTEACLGGAYISAQDATMTFDERQIRTLSTLDPSEDPALADELHRAIAAGELELHYQPQIELATGMPVGLEALVRWNRPGFGLVPPDEFLPAAAAAGLMSELTSWVIRTATRQLAVWQADAVILHGFRVSVNVPASEFAETRIVTLVRSALERSGLEPGDLVVELTESRRLEGTWGAVAEAMRLRSVLGVDLSIDDFGTGWSSIALLHEVGAEELKLDRSFVQDLDNPNCHRLVEAVVGMARSLGMRVVAEGIETGDQLRAVKRIGCDLGQGWLWGKAVPADEVEALLSARGDMLEQIPA